MAQFTVYRSTDASAPTLSGTAGDLVNLLDKCLVTGYGSKVAAGWTKPYVSGITGAVFRPALGTRFYLNVNDNAPGLGGAREARVVGYEVMTAFATGTNLFPTAAQAANGLFVRKSATADAVTRPWVVFADGRTFYMFIESGDTAGRWFGWMFGDFYSIASGDLYNCMLIARDAENTGAIATENLDKTRNNSQEAAVTGHYVARGYFGNVGAQGVIKLGSPEGISTTALVFGSVGLPVPNPTDQRLYLAPALIIDPATLPIRHRRGWLRGFWHMVHPAGSVPMNWVFDGTDSLVGRQFMTFGALSGNGGFYCLEVSNTLDTN